MYIQHLVMNANGITKQDRLDLKKLLHEMNSEDNTKYIREIKQSARIHADVLDLVHLMRDQATLLREQPSEFEAQARKKCTFLYEAYPDMFKKILVDEIDLTILTKLLQVLKMIEEEKVDQHEGSVLVGKILKELYLDSAVRHGDNLDKQRAEEKPIPESGKPLSWQEFKTKTKNPI